MRLSLIFIYSMMGLLIYKYEALILTRSQCEVYYTQVTVKALWASCLNIENFTLIDLVCSQQSLIQPDQMRIVLESEAASVYCQYMRLGEDILTKDPFKEKIEKTVFKFMVSKVTNLYHLREG